MWISVEDDLPDDNRAVLVAIEWPSYPDGKIKRGVDMAESERGEWISYHREDEYRSECEGLFDSIKATVTHWMPLPVGPEDDNTDS